MRDIFAERVNIQPFPAADGFPLLYGCFNGTPRKFASRTARRQKRS